jgi:hypothetical protein
MKLSFRQRKIILTFIISFVFSVTIISVPIFLFSKSRQNSPSFEDNNSNLTKFKNEIVKEIEQKLNSSNIKESDLLQKLKDNQYLATGENN